LFTKKTILSGALENYSKPISKNAPKKTKRAADYAYTTRLPKKWYYNKFLFKIIMKVTAEKINFLLLNLLIEHTNTKSKID